MSNFPQNLSILRRRAGYTQEGLAEALDVSRQAVSKWESGQSLPEAATLLTLADLLHCTLDQLMREELSEDGFVEEEDSGWQEGLYAAWCAHVDRFALMMAAGVALVLLGVAGSAAAEAFSVREELAALPLFGCLIVAVFLFVMGGMAHTDFQKNYPEMPDCALPEERAQFQRVFRIGMAAAVAGILADVAVLVALTSFFPGERAEMLATALFLVGVALCVGVMVFLGVETEKYELEKYGEQEKKDGPNISGAIMLAATAVFLLAGFLRGLWHPGWVVFPIAGILCGIVENLRKK